MPKILLVEDEKVLRDAFMILLQAQSYDIDSANNGQEALERIKKNHYDLILLDLMMPVLDGVGFLKKAELHKKHPDTRVVLLSNLSSGDMVVQAMKLGAHRQEVKSDLRPKDIIMIIEQELAAH